MKATGIVRRIDDLGRIVIPKEIRRTLRIREGDPLEIFTDQKEGVVLRKYSMIGELMAYAGDYAESLAQTTGCTVCIADKERIVAASGNGKKQLQDQILSVKLETVMEERKERLFNGKEAKCFEIGKEQTEEYTSLAVAPVLSAGDVVGAVMILTKDEKKKFGEAELLLVQAAAGFFGKQMES